MSGVAENGTNTVAGSTVHVTETFVTGTGEVPDPLATAQGGPDGCVRIVTA